MVFSEKGGSLICSLSNSARTPLRILRGDVLTPDGERSARKAMLSKINLASERT